MNIDVKPSILGLLGLESKAPTDGRDLSRTLTGEDDWTGHPFVFSETFYGRSNKATVISPDHQLVRRHRKRKRPAVLETLHSVDDRLSERDLMGTEPEVTALLQERLDSWLTEMKKRWDSAGAPVSTSLSPELERQLEALGYIE